MASILSCDQRIAVEGRSVCRLLRRRSELDSAVMMQFIKVTEGLPRGYQAATLVQEAAAVIDVQLALAGPLFAQEKRPSVPAHLRDVQAVLVAAYPELREGRIAWRVESTEAGLVVEARVGSTALEVPAPTPAMLAATVVVDEQGRLQEMRARGTLIATARAKVSTMGISRGQGAKAAAVRPKYPPDDPEALETLVPLGLSVILGVTSVGERTFREVVEDAPDEAQTWHVEAEARTFRYALVFEPIEGRLLSVVRR